MNGNSNFINSKFKINCFKFNGFGRWDPLTPFRGNYMPQQGTILPTASVGFSHSKRWLFPQQALSFPTASVGFSFCKRRLMPRVQYSILSAFSVQSLKAWSASSRMKCSVGMVRSDMGFSISS